VEYHVIKNSLNLINDLIIDIERHYNLSSIHTLLINTLLGNYGDWRLKYISVVGTPFISTM
jgi:hypothetical protein